MDNCIFCKIVKKEIPAYVIYEDEEFLVFPTAQPHKPGHILVIPKEHENYIFDLEDEKLSALILKTKFIAKGLKKAFVPKSGKISVVTMGMGVPHVHIHLIPLDTEADINPDNVYKATTDELKETAEKIRNSLY